MKVITSKQIALSNKLIAEGYKLVDRKNNYEIVLVKGNITIKIA